MGLGTLSAWTVLAGLLLEAGVVARNLLWSEPLHHQLHVVVGMSLMVFRFQILLRSRSSVHNTIREVQDSRPGATNATTRLALCVVSEGGFHWMCPLTAKNVALPP